MLHLLEDPRTAKAGSANHDTIHAVAVKAFARTLGGGDVAIADDGDVHAWIVFHLANQGPVGLTGVHLRASAAMNGQRLDAAILQLLGQVNDNLMALIPAQAGLDRHRHFYRINHGTRDFEHQGDILQHTRSGTLASHALHGAAKVDVKHIGLSLLHNLGRFDHGRHIATINLYGHRSLRLADAQFLLRLAYRANQRIG